jgi:hypothetical protein
LSRGGQRQKFTRTGNRIEDASRKDAKDAKLGEIERIFLCTLGVLARKEILSGKIYSGSTATYTI